MTPQDQGLGRCGQSPEEAVLGGAAQGSWRCGSRTRDTETDDRGEAVVPAQKLLEFFVLVQMLS